MVYDNSTPLLCSCCGCEICDAIKLIMKIFIEQFLLQSLKLILFLPVAFQSLSRRSWSPSAFRWQSRGSGLSWEQCQILCFSLAAIDQQDHQGSFLNRQRTIFNSLTCSLRFLWKHLYFSECPKNISEAIRANEIRSCWLNAASVHPFEPPTHNCTEMWLFFQTIGQNVWWIITVCLIINL